jgi:hypothetical protein
MKKELLRAFMSSAPSSDKSAKVREGMDASNFWLSK